MSRLGSVQIAFGAETSGLFRASASVERRLQKLGQVVEKIGRRAQYAFMGLAGGIGYAIKRAGDLAEEMNKFQAVFGPQADEMAKWADRLGEALGRTGTELKQALATYQSFFVGLGFGAEEAANLSRIMSSLALDFGSFYNVSDPETLQRFISAMSGSAEALDRFGINLKQAALNQELLAMGIEGGTAKATEQQKALARLRILYKVMTRQGALGDAIRTHDSFVNVMRALWSQTKRAVAALGEQFIPQVRAAAKWLAGLAKRIQEMTPRQWESVKGWIVFGGKLLLISAIVPRVVRAFQTLIGVLKTFAATQAVVNALSGNWIMLAAGVAAAVGAWATIDYVIGKLDAAATSTEDATDAVEEYREEMEEAAKAADKLASSLGTTASASRKLEQLAEQTQFTRLVETAKWARDQFGRLQKIETGGTLYVSPTFTSGKEIGELLQKLDEQVDRLQFSEEELFRQRIDALRREQAEIREYLQTEESRLTLSAEARRELERRANMIDGIIARAEKIAELTEKQKQAEEEARREEERRAEAQQRMAEAQRDFAQAQQEYLREAERHLPPLMREQSRFNRERNALQRRIRQATGEEKTTLEATLRYLEKVHAIRKAEILAEEKRKAITEQVAEAEKAIQERRAQVRRFALRAVHEQVQMAVLREPENRQLQALKEIRNQLDAVQRRDAKDRMKALDTLAQKLEEVMKDAGLVAVAAGGTA